MASPILLDVISACVVSALLLCVRAGQTCTQDTDAAFLRRQAGWIALRGYTTTVQ
jgi:hypothetical protein